MNTLQNVPIFIKGVTLRLLRSTYKLSQKAVAPVLKMSQSTYSRMENEEKELNPEELQNILKALKDDGNLLIVGNHFTQMANKDVNEEERHKLIMQENIELKQQNKDLRNNLEKSLEQIQRLFKMLEVKHQIMVA